MTAIVLLTSYGGGGGPPGPTYSPWDVSSLPANVTATAGNFELVRSGGTNSTRIVTQPVTRSTGKYALRFGVIRTGPTSAPGVGLRINASTGTYLGSNTNGWCLFADNIAGSEGAFYNNVGTNLGDLGSASPGPLELMIELDLDSGFIFMGAGGTWPLSQNPATGANPLYSGLVGPVTISAEMFYPGNLLLKIPAQFITPASSGYTPGWPD